MIIDYDRQEVADELELLSNLIRDKLAGEYEAMDIVKGYEDIFDNHVDYGRRLRQYVSDNKLSGIEASHIDLSSKHWIYKLHGGRQVAD
jgi:hypothetical protein